MENFDQWVENNKSRQDELKQALEQRELARTSWSSRRSAESQNRLRLLNEAADTRSEDSEFDDWEVYITMVRFLSLLGTTASDVISPSTSNPIE